MASNLIETIKIDDRYGYTQTVVLGYNSTDSEQNVYVGKGYSASDATTSVGICYRNGRYYKNSWSSERIEGKELTDKIINTLGL